VVAAAPRARTPGVPGDPPSPRRAASRPRRQLLDSVIVGARLLGVGNGSVVFAQSLEVPSGVAAILLDHPEAISTASLVALTYLIFFGSVLAYTSCAWLIRYAPLSLVATHAYLNPVVAVALGIATAAKMIREEMIVRELSGSPRSSPIWECGGTTSSVEP